MKQKSGLASLQQQAVQKQIAQLKSAGACVIGGYRVGPQFVQEIQSAIDAGHAVVYAPKLRAMRHFYNTEGFKISMSQVASHLRNFTITIPADRYGQMHVFALSPQMDRRPADCTSGN